MLGGDRFIFVLMCDPVAMFVMCGKIDDFHCVYENKSAIFVLLITP